MMSYSLIQIPIRSHAARMDREVERAGVPGRVPTGPSFYPGGAETREGHGSRSGPVRLVGSSPAPPSTLGG